MMWWVSMAWAGSLRGVVRDVPSQQPVAGVTLSAGEVSGTTDSQGRFWLELPDGEVELVVSSPEHTLWRRLVVVPGTLEVSMAPLSVMGEVVVEARRPSPHVSRQILDRERVEKVPGTHDDPLRLLQSLPGVAITPEYSPVAGALALRGAAPSESKVFFDGVEIPYLYHFQQYASVMHTRLVDEVALYPSTFGSSFGDATGGVVAVRSRQADTDTLGGGANANSIMVGGYLLAPTGEGAASLSGRRSYLDALESSNDQFTVWPRFWDYLARYDQRVSDGVDLQLTAIGAGDGYSRYAGDTATLDPLQTENADAYTHARRFHGLISRADGTHQHGGWFATLGVIDDQWNGAVGTDSSLRQDRYLWFRGQSAYALGDAMAVHVGGDLRWDRVNRQAEVGQAWVMLEDEDPLLARGIAVEEVLTPLRAGVFVEPQLTFGSAVVRVGGRVQFEEQEQARVDPRGNLQWELAPDLRLRAALGRYSQSPPADARSVITGDPSLGWSWADAASLGLDTTVGGRLELGVEGWAKRIHQAVVVPIDAAPRAQDGDAMGVELTSRYRLRELVFLGASLSLGRATRDGAPFDFDQPWALNLVGSWDFAEDWNAGVRFRAAAGLPYTPVAGATYDGDVDGYLPVSGATNSARLAAYRKVDVHLERAWAFKRWRAVLYGEGWWVPGDANEMYVVYSYDYSEKAFVAGPAFLPLLGFRAEL